MVFANDELVYQKWASEVVKNGSENQMNSLSNSGWQHVSLNLSKYTDGTTLTLAFYAGNENLNLPVASPHQTWVYVDNFSTNQVIANASSTFEIHTTDNSTVQYQLGSDTHIKTEKPFHLASPIDTNTITYRSTNSHGSESKNTFFVDFNDKKPESILDLQALKEEKNQFLLTWTVPSGNHLSFYDIRYAVKENTAWSDMQPVSIITEDGLPFGGYRSPRPIGEEEQYFVRVDQQSPHYYFAVKVKDSAGNESEDSSKALVQLDSEVILDNSKDIVLNEFTQDWVELYNKSSIPIDVNGWEIDEFPSQKKVIILDQPTIKPHGYILIPLPTAFTTNIHDVIQVISRKKDVIDSYEIQFNGVDTRSIGREIDGIGDFTLTSPTPGTPNVVQKSDLQPSLEFLEQSPTLLEFTLRDAQNYTKGRYTIEYENVNNTRNGMTGSFVVSSPKLEKKDLYMGSCSSNGFVFPTNM